MNTGANLITDIDSAQTPPGKIAFWWLGQHSFVIKMAGKCIYIDPFFSLHPERLIPPLITAGEVSHADLVLGTHDHGDHIDRAAWPTIAQNSNATFIVPDLVRESIIADQDIPEDRIVGLDDDTSREFDEIRITGIAGAHEFLDQDPETGRHPWLGYILETEKCKVYHAGDTIKYEGLETRVQQHTPIDLALLPINGRDAHRLANGVVGNMSYQEAVDLAGSISPGLSVPTHYDMFGGNLEDPKHFVDYLRVKYPDLKAKICHYGEKVII